MKTASQSEAYLDFPLPLDCWRSVLELFDDFPDWLLAVSVSALPWRDLGGLVMVVEHYVRLHVRRNDMWYWPQPLIKASTYFPAGVFDRLRQLPPLRLMRALPDRLDDHGMHIAGGYVRIELIRALRAECPGVVHWSIKIPDKANDVDMWIKQVTPKMVKVMCYILGQPLPGKAPHNSSWPLHSTNLDHMVDFVLMKDFYRRDDCMRYGQEHDDMGPTEDRAIGNYVIPGFDLSAVQFAFKRDHSGEVLTTPLALYTLMTGKVVMCHVRPETLEQQCNIIMKYPERYSQVDRIVRRVAKYTFDQYGYTLDTWDDQGPKLTECVKAAYVHIKTDTQHPEGIYYGSPYWDKQKL